MIYKLYWRKLYNMAYYLVQSRQEAEDIVQDVFSSLWYRRERLHIRVSLENYLVRAVKYTAFFYIRLQSRKSAVPENVHPDYRHVSDPEAVLIHKELDSLIGKILRSLPPKTQRVFSLSRFEGLTYAEIAERLDVSVKTVEYHISVALKKFSGKLTYGILLTCLLLS